MKLDFEFVRWQNLLSTGNLMTEIRLDGSHMNLIAGENGEGKSTVLDALCFGLFGKPFRKVKLAQLINTITGRDLVVEIGFRARGKTYLIRRGMKPHFFEVYEDEVLINQDAANKDYQAYLEKHILRTNFRTFTSIGILGSASYVPFMQLPGGQRREVIEDLYDLRIFTGMNSILKKKIDAIEKKISEKETERRLLEQKLELSRRQQKVLHEEKEKQIKHLKLDALQLTTELEATQQKHEALQSENKKLVEALDDVSKLRVADEKCKKFVSELKAQFSILGKELSFFCDNSDCPTCKQQILPELRDTTTDGLKARMEKVTDDIAKVEQKHAEIKRKLDCARRIEDAIAANKSKMYTHSTMVKTIQNRIKKLEESLSRLENEKEEIVDESSLVEIESELVELGKIKAEFLLDQDVAAYAAVILKDTGAKAKIIKKFTPVLNQYINGFLAKLDFHVDFQLDENFDETLKSRGRDDFSYASFSEGEKLRIDLSILFAWRAVAKKRASLDLNIVFLDEILDGSLDQSGIEELIKIMKQNIDGNIFVISHRTDQISDHFDRVIKFEKTKGFSRIAS